MKTDNDYIATLYETIWLNDPFAKRFDENAIDWDKFFYKATEYYTFSTLIESFELKQAQDHSGGRNETYDLETTSGKKFLLTLDFYNKKKVDYFTFAGIQEGRHKNSPQSIEYFSRLKDSFADDEFMCFIRFEDEQGNYEITNKMGMSSFEVFSSLKSAVLHSFESNPSWIKEKVQGITFMVDQKERTERLPLYKKLLTKYFPIYDKIFLDEVSDKNYINLIATK